MNDFTGYSDQPDEQAGNYLALKFDRQPSDSTVKIELVGSGRPEKVMKSNDVVIRVSDKDRETLKFTITNDRLSKTETMTYSLAGLTLTPDE